MTDTATTETTTETTDGQTETAADQVASMVTDGEKGEQETADRPEFLLEKYKTVEDQAKAYPELQKQFGSFTGAPDEYTLGLSEEVKEKGVELQEDHPLLGQAQEFAKELGMNQQGFTKMLDLLATYELHQATSAQEAAAEEIKSLGDNADRRINNLNMWASRNLPEDLVDGFKDMAISADAVKALEQIVSMTRGAAMQPDNAAPTTTITQEELTKMQFEKDENGNRRLQTDKEFAARFRKLSDEFYGTEEFREIVGGKQ